MAAVMVTACATSRGDGAMRVRSDVGEQSAGVFVRPGERIEHEIQASVSIWWKRAMLVIVPRGERRAAVRARAV
jgi:hypothetical protein